MKEFREIFPDPPAELDPDGLDRARIPRHVAVIMDGNGRWAKQRGKMRLSGHKAGVEAVREVIRAASDSGVRFLTLYSFSSENWKRPEDEVSGLMSLFAKTMKAEIDGLHEEHVRVKVIGNKDALPEATHEAFVYGIDKTKNNDGLTLVLAVNYGSRQELLRAATCYAQDVAHAVQQGEGVPLLSEESFAAYLYTDDIPDPDLLIRTSGELRLSNFLLWQVAYTEFYCTDVLWPDFDRYEFLRALLDYQGRERRFGAVK